MSKQDDLNKARDEGFSDGVIYALQVLTLHGYPAGSTYHDDITNGADRTKLIKRAKAEGMSALAGFTKGPHQ